MNVINETVLFLIVIHFSTVKPPNCGLHPHSRLRKNDLSHELILHEFELPNSGTSSSLVS